MNKSNKKESKQTTPDIRTAYSFPSPKGGRPLLKVPVNAEQTEFAIVEADVWHELRDLGLYPNLSLINKCVMAWCGNPAIKKYYPLKCLIADVTIDDKVAVADGNELNLIRSNLIIGRHRSDSYRSFLDPDYGSKAVMQYDSREWGFKNYEDLANERAERNRFV